MSSRSVKQIQTRNAHEASGSVRPSRVGAEGAGARSLGQSPGGRSGRRRGWWPTVRTGLIGHIYEAPLELLGMVMGTLQRARGAARVTEDLQSSALHTKLLFGPLSFGFPTKESRASDRLPPADHQRGHMASLLGQGSLHRQCL